MDKNYILIIGWVAVMAMLSVLTSVKQEETVCGKKEYRWRPVWAVVTVLPLVWMCSQRGGIMDTGAYLEGYKDMPRAFGGIISYIETVKKDKGFYFLSAVIKCIVGNRSAVYLMTSYTYRDSCYCCPYAGENRQGNITIGDFWCVELVHPELIKENNGPLHYQWYAPRQEDNKK